MCFAIPSFNLQPPLIETGFPASPETGSEVFAVGSCDPLRMPRLLVGSLGLSFRARRAWGGALGGHPQKIWPVEFEDLANSKMLTFP